MIHLNQYKYLFLKTEMLTNWEARVVQPEDVNVTTHITDEEQVEFWNHFYLPWVLHAAN